PQWAALIAIADQGRALKGQSSLDGATQTLAAIYAVSAGDFHDITVGSTQFQATGPGYDLATGRGTPVADKLIADLSGWSSSTATSSTAAQVTWSASTGATSYAVYWWNGSQAVKVGQTTATITSLTVTGLKAGTTNRFYVTASNATSSASTGWVSVVMPAAPAA